MFDLPSLYYLQFTTADIRTTSWQRQN